MATTTIEVLQVEPRQGKGSRSCARLRAEGRIPGVIYGKGETNRDIAIPVRELRQVLEEGRRTLQVSLGGETIDVLVKEIQHGTYDHQLLHADFVYLKADVAVRIEVDVVLTGVAAGTKTGGQIDHVLHSMPVECLPRDIPRNITAAIDALEIGDILHVGDLPPVPGVTFLLPPATPVVTCHMPAGEEEAAATPAEGAAEATTAEPEVIGRKKEDEEEGESAKDKPKEREKKA